MKNRRVFLKKKQSPDPSATTASSAAPTTTQSPAPSARVPITGDSGLSLSSSPPLLSPSELEELEAEEERAQAELLRLKITGKIIECQTCRRWVEPADTCPLWQRKSSPNFKE